MKNGLLLLAFCLLLPCADARTYTFFETGRNRTFLLLPAQAAAEEKAAAELLSSVFLKMGGVTPSSGAAPEKGGVTIRIGRTPQGLKCLAEAGRIDRDGFLIRSIDAGNIVIIGGGPLGTLFGVMEFLERYAGVMWVWPGKYGTVIPKRKSFTADIQDQKEEPAFRIRQLGVDPGMARFFRQAVRGTQDERAQYSHNINKTMPPKLWETHPEYFNMLNGVRNKPVRMKRQACTSNPEVVKIFINGAKQYFRRFPERESFSVAQSDGGHFCECPACRALDVPGVPGVTDRYFTFVNQVAAGIREDFPGKFIASLAYGDGTQCPPVRIGLLPNVIPCLVIPGMPDPIRTVEAWAAKAKQLYAYFHMHGRENPKLHAGALAEYLRFLRKNKVVGICGELHPALPKLNGSYEIDGPRSWLAGKLVWDPDRDPKQLLKAFCRGFYGPAAAPMERYFEVLERAWDRRKNRFDFRCDYDNDGFFLYTPEDMREMVSCVREAEKLAGNDPEVRGRIGALKSRLFPRAAYYCFIGMKDDPTPEKVAARIGEARKLNPACPLLYLPADEAEAVDSAFRKLPRARFAPLLEMTPELARFANAGPGSGNLCTNPGFEKKGKAKKNSAPDWKQLGAANWNSWIGIYTPGKIELSAKGARSGNAGALFTGCQAATVNYVFPVKPGERYRVAAWFRGTGGGISVQFKDAQNKWLHKSSFVKVSVPASPGAFREGALTFVVPPKAARCVGLFGARDQKPGETLAVDDVSVTRFE